jgi:hypothetical protein
MADYGGRPKLCHINMVLQRMADRIGVIACGGGKNLPNPNAIREIDTLLIPTSIQLSGRKNKLYSV